MVDIEEVQKHNTKKDCWVIIHGRAYDVSHFIDEHPGGSKVILKYAGKDATKEFDPIHPGDTLTKYLSPEHHKGEVTGMEKLKKKKKKAANVKAAEPKAAAPVGAELAQSPKAVGDQVVDEYDVQYDEQENKEPLPATLVTQNGDSVAVEVTSDEDDEYDDDEDDPPSEEELERRKMVKLKPELSFIYNLNDFEFVARHTMDKIAWAYYSSGSDDEITLRENHLSYHRFYFKPRILVDVTNIDTSTTMLGTKCSAPFYVTATALGKLGHKDGETVLTKAAAKQDIIQMIPTLASCSFDEIVDASDGKQTQWFQLYVNKDRKICESIVRHAEERGVTGLFITVDAPQLGRREKDMRSKNVEELSNVQGDDEDADRSQGAARAISSFIDTGLSWKDIAFFRSITKMKLILKGVQCVEDALLAVENGLDGIVLSNHGGRQLEFSPPPIEVLAELMPILRARNLQDKIEVFVDGGVRRASDVLKAICLGAKGVGIGRPFLYAMSTYGVDGVFKAIQILKDEMIMDMRLLGVTSIDQLDDSYINSKISARFVPDDKLFSGIYQPLTSPAFKDSKL
ncbi:uncharacterized protein PRCAT00004005001 [Priceomyces carsonii]|uniref:uncharacterized protein n=1 Tax=Priceomyces carsonii TaxID=28549 RepID=UPI002EDAEDD8|nr:unnamed protein product [Priceomyces carsonii]